MKKTVFITGASRGIGRACAIYFAQKGYDVGINYLNNKEKADEVADVVRSMGRSAYIYQGDVADFEQMKSVITKCINDLEHIDVVVNNAGIAQQKLFTDISPKEWRKMFSVNVDGMYNVLQAVLPYMINKKSGSIVNVSSMWGVQGASCEVHYSAAKSAVIGLTKALAQELAPSGIRVNCVAPGLIDTEMNNNLTKEDLKGVIEEIPLDKIGTPKDVARAIYFLADDEHSSFTTGAVLNVNGGMVI